MDFCYLVRRSVIDTVDLQNIEAALDRFHALRGIFQDTGACDGFSLPRQHALTHYPRLIRDFGAPNGLCTSITESKHIVAVKKPWRRTSKNRPLGQMLLINQRLSKLAAVTAIFKSRGMLEGSLFDAAFAALSQHFNDVVEQEVLAGGSDDSDADDSDADDSDEDEDEDEDGPDKEVIPDPVDDVEGEFCDEPAVLGEVALARTPARGYPSSVDLLAAHVGFPELPDLIRRFLHEQLNSTASDDDIPIDACPVIPRRTRLRVFHCARAVFHAPSDISGVDGTRSEYIRSTPGWRGQGPRRDCVLAETDSEASGMLGMSVLRVMMFFDFEHRGVHYPCALVEWFSREEDTPDADTGMWIVSADGEDGERDISVVHIDTILRLAHLIPVYGTDFLPSRGIHFSNSLDIFDTFFSLSIIGDLRDEGAHSALSLISHPGDLPILRNLSLEDVGTAPIKEETDEVAFDFFEHALALTNLTLAGSLGTSLIDVYVLYDNITAFTCKDMDAEVLLDFLVLMPNLERLDFSGPSGLASPSWELCFDEPADDDVKTGCICCHCIEEDEDIALELSHLKQLIIRDTAQAVSSELLDFLCFPAIEEVTLKRDEKFETEVMVALQSDIHDGGGDVERLIVNYV
ncbi:hypothetical protein EV715DRAFT_288545 [Schizophyllum commune]